MLKKQNIINELILTAGPSITDREVSYVLDAAKNGWNNQHSDYIRQFEKEFGAYTGAKHAMATSSCTGAMHLALVALGIGKGDEVIVPEITWIATAAVVEYIGATPVFCDVDADTWTMNPESVASLITENTRAIMPVHTYGHPCDMQPLWDLAKKHDLKIIEDAAQSIGAEYKGQKTGSLGDAAAFSFQGAKAVVTGEGGMLLCNNTALYEKSLFYGDQCRDHNKALFNLDIGYKYKMSNVQAALGLAQTQRANDLINKKIQIFKWYQQRLADVEEITLNTEKSWAKNIYWMSSMVLSNKVKQDRLEFMAELKQRNIDSRPIFYPLSSFPMFNTTDNPNAYHVGNRGINLPSGHNRTEEEVDYICSHIKDIIANKKAISIKGWLQYREEVHAKISTLKQDNSDNIISIADNGKQIGYLKPITQSSINNNAHLQLLTTWRSENQEYFSTQFKVTNEGTKLWLVNLLEQAKDRLLFFVCNNDGQEIGHVGLYRFDFHKQFCELDNIIRGVKNVSKFIMRHACKTLIDYAYKEFSLDKIYLQVTSDNKPALDLYKHLGFVEIQRMPLSKQIMHSGTNWLSTSPDTYEEVSRYNITMCLQAQ
jgi:perosamine synthetase